MSLKKFNNLFTRHFPQVIILILIVGCQAVGPNYEGSPEMDVPENWNNELNDEFVGQGDKQKQWWTLLDDPVLNNLIDKAAIDNLDAKIALARVEEARAKFGIVEATKFPEIESVGDASRKSNSKSATGDRGTDNYTSIGLDLSWEIDIFGYVRRSIEAADAQLQASVENYRDVMVIMYAEIAKNYIALRTFQERLQFAL